MARKQALGIGSFANPFAVKQKPQTGIGGMSMQPIDARYTAGMNAQDIMANYGYTRDENTGNVGLPETVDTRGTGRYWTGSQYEAVRSAPGGQGGDVSIDGGYPAFKAVAAPVGQPAPTPPAAQAPVLNPVTPQVQPGFRRIVTPNTSKRFR